MNRPLKFRVWVEESKCWGGFETWIGDSYCGLDEHDVIVTQYIGFKDTQGREIYEGDIIEYDERQIGGWHGIGEVIYNTDMSFYGAPNFGMWSCKILSRENMKENQTGIGYSVFPFNAKVIGNIFENKNLISN